MQVNGKIQEIIKSEEVLFAYLKDTIYHPEQAKLELDSVEEHLQRLGKELQFLNACLRETKLLAENLEHGKFTENIPARADNPFVVPYKKLQSNLQQLVRITQCAIKGEKECYIDCMGDLSQAFNELFRQLQEQRSRLETSAHTDALTGVGNRLYFDLQVKKLWLQQTPCTVAFIDMDELKYCNDTFGHTEGDFYIIRVSNLLQQLCGEQEQVFRIGGDEFVILSLTASAEELRKRLEEAHEHFKAKMEKLVDYPCDFSFGCTHADSMDEQAYNNLLLTADQKMYEYKLNKKRSAWGHRKDTPSESVLDTHYGLESRIFEALSRTMSNRYIYVCNMRTNMSRWSANAVKEFDLPGEYMLDAGGIWMEHLHPDDREVYAKDIGAIMSGKKSYHKMQYRARNAKGFYVMCSCDGYVLRGKGEEPDIFVGTITNHGAIDTIDPITNLGNTFKFFEYITEKQQKHEPVEIFVVGISEFHVINDSYGYEAGNIVLHNFAQQVQELLDEETKFFRLNGVKFAIVMRSATHEDIQKLYDKLKKTVNNQLYFGKNQAKLYFGAAAMHHENDTEAITPLLSELDYYIRMSKYENNGELVYVDEEYNQRAKRRIAILRDVKASMLNNCEGFYLQYQPQTDADGRVVGAEALLRYKNVTWGVVPPLEYISHLEGDIYFYDLGLWILRRALSEGAKLLCKHPDFCMSVNVSYKQLEHDSFPDDVMDILAKSGFPAGNLVLEFTEHCRTLDASRLKKLVTVFHSHGIRISADDFGTGHATLMLLRDLPFDTIKLDQSFTRGIIEHEVDSIVVEAIMDCAHKLRMCVCMEGIETEKLLEKAHALGADYYQGYLIAKPLDFSDLRDFVDKHNKRFEA